MKTSWKNILAIVLIFICGIIIGTAGTLLLERSIIRRAVENPMRARHVLINRMARQYDLSDEQKNAISSIIIDEADKIAKIRARVAPDVEMVLDDARQRISAELNESQKGKFEEHYEKWLTRFRKIYYAGIDENVRQTSE